MNSALNFFLWLSGTASLSLEIIKRLFTKKLQVRLIVEQIKAVGISSIPLIAVTAGSTGMVMALQFGMGLEKFGGTLYVPKIVSLSIIREMGPVFTSLMLAAKVGAGITSEIGSMTVTQQIDAIRALGTSPIDKIVIPRVLACLISVPILATLANIIGIVGGLVVGVTDLGLDPEFYIQKVYGTITVTDYLSGFGKTVFFAIFIAVPSCYYGLNVKNGAAEVGVATRKSVVTSSILILVGDYFLTKLFWVIEQVL